MAKRARKAARALAEGGIVTSGGGLFAS